MNDPHQLEGVALQNENSLKALVRAIRLSQGQFRLILARCNYGALRKRMVQRLRELSPIEIRELVLPESVKSLYSAIHAELRDEVPQTLMVFGLESVNDIRAVLTSSNTIREEFSKNFPFPLVLWVNDEVFKKLLRTASDLESWATNFEFTITTGELVEFLQNEVDCLFTTVLDLGADQFLDNAPLNFGISVDKRCELESALNQLQRRGYYDSVLEASQQFILGQDAYAHNQMERARRLYEQSLAFWQQQQTSQEPGNLESNEQAKNSKSKIQNQKLIERQACLLFHLGLWWRKYAVLYRVEYETAYRRAQDYYQQCVEGLQEANCPELAAKFINAWAEVLQQLERWDELEAVAHKAVKLHQTYSSSLRLARAYGFLAEVALARSNWKQTQQYAEIALAANGLPLESALIEPIHESPLQAWGTDWVWARQLDRSWYRLLLAQAQQHLEQLPQAYINLKQAKVECKPEYHPQLYLRILEVLRSLFFEQQRYLEAFNTKLERRRVEQQYGFRAFIGAGRLESQRRVINPALGLTGSVGFDNPIDNDLGQTTIAQEIIASGRKPDVERLIERITRPDYKLTVIYGPSGVGKSSLLTAGLVPALYEKGSIDSRNPCPIVIRDYTNWLETLGQTFADKLNLSTLQTFNISTLLEYLLNNVERNLLTVLIFDQFEEFFFNCPKPLDRRLFWEFLHSCLDRADIPFVKVILSVREDYLHNLLECDRLAILEITKNDILNKQFRYYLGNFSQDSAKNLIQSLTQGSFYLEPVLIEQLVQDLAGEWGEVLPIELQVVGTQLQTDKITTLEQYREQGNKEKLVERFLEEVIKDCGKDKEQSADLVLYLLTDEKNTRPAKTRSELTADLAELEVNLEVDKLNWILEILIKSGLVFQLPQFPSDRYQLVHDYLVFFIRQRRGKELIAQLKKEKAQRRKKEAELAQFNQVLKRRLQKAYIGGVGLAILGIIGGGFWRESAINQTNAELKAQIFRSKELLVSNRNFDALLETLKVVDKLKRTRWVEADTNTQVVAALQKAVYSVRESNRLERHSGIVNSVSFSPDGQKIVSASDDGTIKIWNLQGRELQTLKEHRDAVNSVSFSPDGKMIVSGSKDGTVKLWNLQGKEFQLKKQFSDKRDKEPSEKLTDVQDNIYSVSFSLDGQIIASASAWGIVNLWKLQGEKLPSPNGHRPYSVSFSPDRKWLASAGEDSTVELWTVQLWDLKSNEIRTLNNYKNKVNSVSFSPDSKRIALASEDGTVKLWSLDGKESETLNGHRGAVNSVSFSPDGKMIASGSEDGSIKLWSLDGKESETLNGHRGAVNSVSFFSPDGQILVLASASSDKTVKLWSLQSREPPGGNPDLDDLLKRGCNWLKDYFSTHPESLKEFPDCQS